MLVIVVIVVIEEKVVSTVGTNCTGDETVRSFEHVSPM